MTAVQSRLGSIPILFKMHTEVSSEYGCKEIPEQRSYR